MTKKMLGVDLAEDASKLQEEKFGFKGVDCVEHAPDVKLPTLIAGMKADIYGSDAERGNDMQHIFDALTTEKKLHFFGPGTDNPFGCGLRFEGYGYYNYHPEALIEFLNKHTGGVSAPAEVQPAAEFKLEKDEDHPNCQQCGVAFGFPRPRRHHCRVCGRVLCSKCSAKQVDNDRACTACWVHDEVKKMNVSGAKDPETNFETTVLIDAPASTVWQILTSGDCSWSSSLQSIEGEIKEGAEVNVKFKFAGLDFDVKHTVKDFQDGVQFSWSDEIGHGISNNHLFRVEAIDETHCRFINNDELIGGDPIVRYSVLREMKASYELQNEELKDEAEARHAAE